MDSSTPKTLEMIATVEDIAVRLVGLAMAPSIMSFFASAPALFSDVQVLASDVNFVLPELTVLSVDELAQLGSSALSMVSAVIAAIKKR